MDDRDRGQANQRPGPEMFDVEIGNRRVRVLEWGTGPPVVLLHPNGFCAGFFAPLAEHLADQCHLIALDLPGHGASDPPEQPGGYEFAALAADVLDVLDARHVTDAAVVGESLGGAVAILADRVRIGVWRQVVLCEAVAFPVLRQTGTGNPVAAGARARRAHWPDRAAMRDAYARKPPLSELAPEALDAYLAWGTRTLDDGSVTLACHPDDEATIFEISGQPQGAPAAWDHLANISSPTTVISGDRSFLPPEWFAAQAARSGSTHEVIDGGHFFVQENAEGAAQLLRRHLQL